MFYCDDCAAKEGWKTSTVLSYGKCEVCGKNAACSDVPARLLPRGSRPDYAIVIDQPHDAIVLRDVLRRAAQDRLSKASKATQRNALNRNTEEHEVLAKYALRCEQIRLAEAARITRNLGLTPTQEATA